MCCCLLSCGHLSNLGNPDTASAFGKTKRSTICRIWRTSGKRGMWGYFCLACAFVMFTTLILPSICPGRMGTGSSSALTCTCFAGHALAVQCSCWAQILGLSPMQTATATLLRWANVQWVSCRISVQTGKTRTSDMKLVCAPHTMSSKPLQLMMIYWQRCNRGIWITRSPIHLMPYIVEK
jgi:hypothetical protein